MKDVKMVVAQTRKYFYMLVHSKAILLILAVALFILTIFVKDIIGRTLMQ